MIPNDNTGFGKDLSPEIIIDKYPVSTVSFAIILSDLDVPFVEEFYHWVIWNISPTKSIPEGLPKGEVITNPFFAVQGIAWGKHLYRGPKQPFFIKKAHRYLIHVYALDTLLDENASMNGDMLKKKMEGHILDDASLIGIYSPKEKQNKKKK